MEPSTGRPARPLIPALTWEARLDAADSAFEIVRIAKDFLTQFSPFALHSLPEPYRPPCRLSHRDDLAAYASAIVDGRHDVSRANASLVRKLVAFFSRASLRLSRFPKFVPDTNF